MPRPFWRAISHKESDIEGMKLRQTLSVIQDNQDYKDLVGIVGKRNKTVVSIGSAARPYFIASLYESVRKPLLVITPNAERARNLVENLRGYCAEAELFPEVETMPYDSLSPSPASVGRRLAVLDNMASGKIRMLVSSVQSAMRIMPPRKAQVHRPITLKTGREVDLYKLAGDLIIKGYTRVPLVENPGQFSLRGGIIDIFPSNANTPVRLELFGDEIDSIRTFTASNQRSTGHLQEIDIYGCRQLVLTEEAVNRAIASLSGPHPSWLEDEIGKLKDEQYFEGIDKYLPFLYEDNSTVLDYVPENSILVIDELEETAQLAERHFAQQSSYVNHLVEHQAVIKPPHPYFKKPAEIINAESKVDLISVGGTNKTDAIFKASPIQPMVGNIEQLKDLVNDYLKIGLKVAISLCDEDQLKRMSQILAEIGMPHSTKPGLSKKEIGLTIGELRGGFVSIDIGLAVISFTDIFGRKGSRQKNQARIRGRTISDIAELKIGDYVVHSTHGIAVYGGLQRREVAGVIRDYALLEYAGSDRLFVPVDQLDRITKYIGAAGEKPTISRLGSSEWLKAKKKVKAAVKKVAYNLLSLYAERARAKGFAFSPDTPWQQELEDTFPYEETTDQLKSIEEVKRDMEDIKPMDRLICGDVGYGKTEVAVRATFKAVTDGKQVMVLVPTTILAQQHFKTFSERLSSFPITVEMVSRFRSAAQQKDIIDRFNKGNVDVLIGTHRLLQKDVSPLNLGLVIVDEEQRFGVNDKEKLRNFKKSVDVLTLSATPIPRTLQMSLSGIRDMSVIETPPEGRYPVITYVGGYDEEMMIQAIRREIGRGGQVYFVHNRVETIDRIAKRIEDLVPGIRVAVAHGQMSEHQLEKKMLAFLERRYDVLVCTTIIESGIDIPSVNTLIVDRAEMLGLAQLYQLRGRVGRADQRAYAYFFFSPQRLLTTQAFERLKTISDFTDLGSGIKVALRDLEIRGSGSLFGAEQHGQMSVVGFELYCQMIREAIEELEGKQISEPLDIKIDIPVNAYLPDTYINEESLRIEAYKRIILAKDVSEVNQITLELKDRYGTCPEPVNALLDIARLRLMAKELGITEVSYQNGRVRMSPIRLTKQQEAILAGSYKNLVFRPERWYLLATKLEHDRIISFLLALFDDIISELTTEVMISQKAR